MSIFPVRVVVPNMTNGELDNNDQWALLAGLRFFLSLTVILGHYSLLIKHDKHGIFGAGLLNPGSAVFGFFILSGYSIAASVDRDTNDFYFRRFVRIWPLYLTSLAIGLLVYLIVPAGFNWPLGGFTGPAPAMTIVASLLMLQTVIADPIPSVAVIWSLSAEWWHYMIAPYLRKLPSGLLLVGVLASFLVFMLVSPPPGRGPEGFEHGIGIVALSWMWVSGFIFYRYRRQPFGFLIIAMPSVLVLYFGHFIGMPMFISIFTLIMCDQLKFSPWTRRSLNYLGDLSFPMYLFQAPVMIALITFGANGKALIVGGIILLSAASLHFIDYPCREAFRKLHRGRARIFAGTGGEIQIETAQ